jgi:uncharacterized NAD(P)/FAD-binding protein YdhS
MIDVTIVGGGFSGCAVAAALARRAGPDLALCLFEPAEPGRGAAYGTPHAEHLLNTRAEAMSLHADEPEHFMRWLGSRGGPRDFVSRQLYGDYVAECSRRLFERPRFSLIRERVCSIKRDGSGGFTVTSTLGSRYRARAVVLATGNPPPNDDFLPRTVIRHPGYVGDPWRFDYRGVDGEVLVIGAGLTALDVLVALESAGHRGAVHVLSRRGRFPEVHDDVVPYDVVPALDGADARALVRSFRRHVREAADRGFDWRAVVDAIRPESEAIWRRLGSAEQRRFERHVRAEWDRHRHRAPAQVDATRERYRRSGRLFTHAGRLVALRRSRATIELAAGGTVEVRPDWIVNCSGLAKGSALLRDRLLGWMTADGSLSLDPAGLGLRVAANLTAIDADGEPVTALWVVGPAVRGARFEATAVPELRAIAALVACEVVRWLQPEEGVIPSPKKATLLAGPSWARTL